MSIAHRRGDGKLELRNMPTGDERQVLFKRGQEVFAALKQSDKKRTGIAIAEMLAVYDIAQSKRATAAERREAEALYTKELHGVPVWATEEACKRIRLGTAGEEISRAYKPTPIQVRVLAVSIAQPWKNEAEQISEILGAQEYFEGPSDEVREVVGEKMRGLAEALRNSGKQFDEQDRQRHEAAMAHSAERARMKIVQEWEEMGEPPRMTGEIMLSPSLVRLIDEHKKRERMERASAPVAQKPEEDIPF